MAKKKIDIKCTSATEFSLDQLNELQGDLKERTPEAMKRLKKSILKHGFIAPFFVWENPENGQLMILDGHSRLNVLNEMKAAGHPMPQFPVDFIDATNINDAKAKLLAISSNYGKFTKKGVDDFLEGMDFDEDFFGTIDIPFMDELDMNILEPDDGSLPSQETVTVSEHERAKSGKVDLDGYEKFSHKCPRCSHEWSDK